ncbi:hypothetical protein GGS21DRAFT_306642 [Xylaria nigripes]|nr:hypothetical protein GGS21DRAFT_306642 [Xylaria nigripes]
MHLEGGDRESSLSVCFSLSLSLSLSLFLVRPAATDETLLSPTGFHSSAAAARSEENRKCDAPRGGIRPRPAYRINETPVRLEASLAEQGCITGCMSVCVCVCVCVYGFGRRRRPSPAVVPHLIIYQPACRDNMAPSLPPPLSKASTIL